MSSSAASNLSATATAVVRHSSSGFIDCYRRAAFVLTKPSRRRLASSLEASRQGPSTTPCCAPAPGRELRPRPARREGRPPFLIVVDVGNVIELYAEFTRSGATYTPFPDPRSHRIRLADLRDEAIRARLAAVWLDPLSLDPTRHAARVTREIAGHLAEAGQAAGSAGHAPRPSPASSPAACSACSPRMSA
jgi:hypothetical protein